LAEQAGGAAVIQIKLEGIKPAIAEVQGKLQAGWRPALQAGLQR
jgi:hypothetical protein